MKTTVTLWHFRQAFQELRPHNFSYSGLRALFEHLDELEQDCGTEIELDVIALCCDFSEYTSAENACQAYGIKAIDENEALEKLINETSVIQFDGGIIVRDF